MARHIKKGDLVAVLSGKYKGARGKVLAVLVERQRVKVEGLAEQLRHLKPNRDPNYPKGGIVKKTGSLHISNVLPVDPKTQKPTRVRFVIKEDGSKVRIAKRSGEELSTVRTAPQLRTAGFQQQ